MFCLGQCAHYLEYISAVFGLASVPTTKKILQQISVWPVCPQWRRYFGKFMFGQCAQKFRSYFRKFLFGQFAND